MKSHAKFYAALGLLVLLNAIIKPIWIFGIDRQVQNAVGAAEYGTYFSLLNLSLVFYFLLDWGMTGFFNRQLSAHEETYSGQVGNFLYLKLLFSILYTIIVFACAYLSGIQHWNLLFGIIIIQALTSLFVFARAIITAQQWFNTDAWLSVLDKSLMILLCGTVLLFPSLVGEISTGKFVVYQAVSTLVALLFALIIINRRRLRISPVNFRSFLNRKLFTSAFPFALLLLLMSAHFRLDGFLLERLHSNGAEEAGIYAASYRLLDAANMVGFLFASFVLPYIARQWQSGSDINNVVLNTRHFLLLFALGLSVFVFFFAPWIQALLYDLPGKKATLVMQYCLPALVGYSLVSVYGTVMTATGHIYAFCLVTAGALVVNVLLNLLLIPREGALACCIAALVSQGLCGIATMIYCKSHLRVLIHLRSLIIYTFNTALLCVLFYYGKLISPWLLAVVAVFITAITAVTTGLVTARKWKFIFNQQN